MYIYNDTDELPTEYRQNVGIVLLNTGDRIFLGRRVHFSTQASCAQSLSDAQYGWQLPQGGIDTGENPHDAVFRELKEELGTDQAQIIKTSSFWYAYAFPDQLNGAPFQRNVWKGAFRGQIQKWFLMRFTGKECDINLNLQTDPPEFSEYIWSTPQQVLGRVISFKHDVYHAVLREFGLHTP